MDVLLEVLWVLADGLGRLFLQPFYYVAIILIMLIYRRQVLLERKLFHVRLHSWVTQTWRTVLGGLAAGAMVSIVAMFIGSTLTWQGIVCLWAVTLLLMLFRIRYLCLAYSVGVLGIVQFVLDFLPNWHIGGWAEAVVETVRGLDIASLLCLVALLHIAEAGLVRWQGASFAGPLFFEGKRGKPIGGYQLQSLWPVPLLLLIPAQTTGTVLPWTPLFGGEAWQGGFQLIALPVLIGFQELTIGMVPEVKARQSAGRLLGYGLVLLVLSLLSWWWSPLTVGVAVVAIVLHEALIWLSQFEESSKSPVFVHPLDGLRVLAILPGSPAEELGIQAGETIIKVNGVPVKTKEELHAALRMNSAFCKLEVRNRQGESKFLQRAIYAGEHHQLGAILAPDEQVLTWVRRKPGSFFQLLRPRQVAERARGNHLEQRSVIVGEEVEPPLS